MMKTSMAAGLAWVVVGLVLAPPVTAAGKYDGSAPMLCAVTSVSECEADGACARSSAGDANLPPFMRVDVSQRALTAHDGSGRKTEIKSSNLVDGQLVLQGGEAGRGWSMVIAVDSGRMGAAIVEHDGTFAVFGACVVP